MAKLVNANIYKSCCMLLFMFSSGFLNAQIASGAPSPADNEPLKIDSTANVIIYIILPIIVIVFYIIYIKRKNLKKNKNIE